VNVKRIESDWNIENLEFKAENTNTNMEEYTYQYKNMQIRLLKFLNYYSEDFKNSKVCYYLNFNSSQNKILNFRLCYKLKNEFFNIKFELNKIIIDYFNNNLIYDEFSFSQKYKGVEQIKQNGEIYLIFHFSIDVFRFQSGTFSFISGQCTESLAEDKISMLKLIYSNNFKIERLFNLKIYIKNNEFNDFFNKKLIKLLINEKLNENKLINTEILLKYVLLISKIFNFDYKTIVKLKSYYDIYMFILKEIFGIEIKGEIIYINPKSEHYDKNFKIIYVDDNVKRHGIYVEQNSTFKGLEVGDVIYSNLKVIDLSLIENNAKFCI
ncbi:MAG: hypothetical protein PHS54_05815, partial [Clostridia bacterium]|nr:hypothetical protein [Clostridia bacterium]